MFLHRRAVQLIALMLMRMDLIGSQLVLSSLKIYRLLQAIRIACFNSFFLLLKGLSKIFHGSGPELGIYYGVAALLGLILFFVVPCHFWFVYSPSKELTRIAPLCVTRLTLSKGLTRKHSSPDVSASSLAFGPSHICFESSLGTQWKRHVCY